LAEDSSWFAGDKPWASRKWRATGTA
jgi:hypothetical protein